MLLSLKLLKRYLLLTESARLRQKFNMNYLLATEKLSYLKYFHISKLEKKHGVDIGVAYTNERYGRVFVYVTGFWKNDPNRTLEVSR